MIVEIIAWVLSGVLMIGSLYVALHLYFNGINKNALPQTMRLDEETKRKFKAICNMEYRTPMEQEKLIIEKFIEEYTIEHNIDWEKTEY